MNRTSDSRRTVKSFNGEISLLESSVRVATVVSRNEASWQSLQQSRGAFDNFFIPHALIASAHVVHDAHYSLLLTFFVVNGRHREIVQ